MAAALTLANHGGLSVAVIEKSSYEAPRIGETLSPGVAPLLKYLGVWNALARAGHQLSHGTAAAWGSDALVERDHLFSPYGSGFHLDRARFDRLLADTAERAGATVWRRARATSCCVAHSGDDAAWTLTIARENDHDSISARFVIDATGRTAWFARKQRARRILDDRQVAISGIWRFPSRPPADTFTLLEAVKDGWWYSCRLPSEDQLAVFITDADIARERRLADESSLMAAMQATTHISHRLRDGRLASALTFHAAQSSRLAPPCGAAWIAVGDAAATWDPLSSSGIPRALDSGIYAARAIEAKLRHGDSRLLELYSSRTEDAFDSYCTMRSRYYALERRFGSSPFWQRRTRSVSLDPYALLKWRDGADPSEVLVDGSRDLTLDDYRELCAATAQPRPAHEVVAELARRRDGTIPDHRIIMALQELHECGVVITVSASSA